MLRRGWRGGTFYLFSQDAHYIRNVIRSVAVALLILHAHGMRCEPPECKFADECALWHGATVELKEPPWTQLYHTVPETPITLPAAATASNAEGKHAEEQGAKQVQSTGSTRNAPNMLFSPAATKASGLS